MISPIFLAAFKTGEKGISEVVNFSPIIGSSVKPMTNTGEEKVALLIDCLKNLQDFNFAGCFAA